MHRISWELRAFRHAKLAARAVRAALPAFRRQHAQNFLGIPCIPTPSTRRQDAPNSPGRPCIWTQAIEKKKGSQKKRTTRRGVRMHRIPWELRAFGHRAGKKKDARKKRTTRRGVRMHRICQKVRAFGHRADQQKKGRQKKKDDQTRLPCEAIPSSPLPLFPSSRCPSGPAYPSSSLPPFPPQEQLDPL